VSASARFARTAAAALAAVLLGVSAASAAPDASDLLRIRGGEVAAEGAHPYAVQLEIRSGERLHGRCTGTLIGARWVATAAHCVTRFTEPGSPVLPDLGIEAVVGAATPADVPEPDPSRVRASHAIAHPGFDLQETGLLNDFALVRLDRPVNGEALAMAGPASAPVAPGMPATILGWGLQGPGQERSPALREGVVPVIDDAACEAADPFDQFDGPTMICAGALPPAGQPAGTCAGDSGGPLIASDARDRRLLIGITSWGFDSSCATGPDVFTEVAAVAPPVLEAAMDDPLAPLASPTVRVRAFAYGQGFAFVTLTAETGHLATDYTVAWRSEAGETGSTSGRLGGVGQTRRAMTLSGLSPGTQHRVEVTLRNALGQTVEAVALTTP
jgi:secreted trypsin-like serine protease